MKNIPEKELGSFLMLNRLGIEGRRTAWTLLRDGKSVLEVSSALGPLIEEARQGLNPDRELALCWEKKISLLTILDPAYPAPLKEIPDPPLLLYVKGEILPDDVNSVAVVGTRHPSFYGRTQAKKFAEGLAMKGLTIVSGLARGIDQVAHEAALGVSYGRTIAVLGSGLDVIYPRENEKLFERIEDRGAVVSEYSLGTPPLAENFPRRNRILSGISLGVFVVEAHSRSGSLITAHQALDQGREVFSLPGPVDQLTSRGTHQLLKEGAILTESPEDILEVLAPRLKTNGAVPVIESEDPRMEKRPLKEQPVMVPVPILPASGEVLGPGIPAEGPDAEENALILEALREEGAMTRDDILDMTGLDPARAFSVLLSLELHRKVRKLPDGKYAL